MPLIDWNDETLTVGLDTVDAMHRDFVTLLNRLETASKVEFPALFAELHAHTESHFAEENALMEQSGFPARAEHQAEHRRVLGELVQFKKRVDKGLVSFGQAYVRERLPEWFLLHTQTMDSALAAHLKTMAEN